MTPQETSPVETAAQNSVPKAKTLGQALQEAVCRYTRDEPVGTIGQELKKAKSRKQKTKAKSKNGAVKYVPGESCPKKGQKHDYVTRSSKKGRQYKVCKKCGSSAMIPEEKA